MKKALISPDEKIISQSGEVIGDRIAEVCATAFEISLPLYWIDCVDDVVADLWYWNGSNCELVPVIEQTSPIETVQGGPNVIA